MNRSEYLQWCKEEAIRTYKFHISGHEYSKPDEAYKLAASTMLVDLKKHPETEGSVCAGTVLLLLTVDSYDSMMKFIEGFN